MSAGGRSIFNQPYSDFLFETEYIPLPKNENKTIDRLKKIILKNKIAGFIFEPLIQGASGMRCYSKSILDKIIEICKNNDIICVADEVMTGFGRTGTNFAVDQQHFTRKALDRCWIRICYYLHSIDIVLCCNVKSGR